MASLEFDLATWQQVLGLLGGDAFTARDAAKRTATVGAGSTTTSIVLDSTIGFTAGDKVNINTGSFPAEGETHSIVAVTDATHLDFTGDAWATTPSSGDVLNDGPEQIELILERMEGEIESRLPGRHALMLRKIEGEVLTRYAQGTETAFTLSVSAATAATVYLWKNLTGPWVDRWRFGEVGSGEYGVSGQTVTLTGALAESTTLVCEYEHSLATPPKVLARVARLLAAVETGELLGLATEPGRVETLERWREEGNRILEELHGGARTIPEFEKIDLYDDTIRPRGIVAGSIERV